MSETEYGFSYERGVDILTGENPEQQESWTPIRFISAVDPQTTSKEIDAATYDDLGSDHMEKTGETAGLNFYVQKHRLSNGNYLPEVEALLAATKPTATGEAATVTVRHYDKPAGEQKANKNDAFQMKCTVSMTEAETGNSGIAGWNVQLKAKGPRTQIVNPRNSD